MGKVCEIVKKQLALPDDSSVTGDSKFSALGADSLDTVTNQFCLKHVINAMLIVYLFHGEIYTCKLYEVLVFKFGRFCQIF